MSIHTSDRNGGNYPGTVNTPGVPQIAPSVHEQVKEALLPALADWCKHTVEGVQKTPPDRTAMNNWARAMNVIGADVVVNFNVQMQKELGCTVEEARRKIAMVASVEGIEYEGAVSVMELEVRAFYAARGKRVMIVEDAQEVAS